MLKKIFIVFGVSFIISIPNVSAKEYYQNDYGVVLNKEEYEFLSYIFWDGCQSLLTKSDYINFINSNIMNGELDSKIYEEPMLRSAVIEDNNRTLKISKSCTDNCFISVTLTWKNTPIVKSYDVLGAYLDGASLLNTPTTSIQTASSSTKITDLKKDNNGFGTSMLLPKYGNNIIINQNFRTSKSGTIYASYQHAKSNITLSDSKNYTFSKTGYGGVFKFNGTAASVYDKMNGVSISL